VRKNLPKRSIVVSEKENWQQANVNRRTLNILCEIANLQETYGYRCTMVHLWEHPHQCYSTNN